MAKASWEVEMTMPDLTADFRIVVALGAPGSGKGTQAKMLCKLYKFYHLSTGDLLRAVQKDETSPFSPIINDRMSKGILVSDEIINDIVKYTIRNILESNMFRGILFDGYPRTIEQAEFLDSCLAGMKLKVDRAILFDMPEDSLIDRVVNRFSCASCGAIYNEISKRPKVNDTCDVCKSVNNFSKRPDDNADTMKKRIAIFSEISSKLSIYYEPSGIFAAVDAELPQDKLFDVLKKMLEK